MPLAVHIFAWSGPRDKRPTHVDSHYLVCLVAHRQSIKVESIASSRIQLYDLFWNENLSYIDKIDRKNVENTVIVKAAYHTQETSSSPSKGIGSFSFPSWISSTESCFRDCCDAAMFWEDKSNWLDFWRWRLVEDFIDTLVLVWLGTICSKTLFHPT